MSFHAMIPQASSTFLCLDHAWHCVRQNSKKSSSTHTTHTVEIHRPAICGVPLSHLHFCRTWRFLCIGTCPGTRFSSEVFSNGNLCSPQSTYPFACGTIAVPASAISRVGSCLRPVVRNHASFPTVYHWVVPNLVSQHIPLVQPPVRAPGGCVCCAG